MTAKMGKSWFVELVFPHSYAIIAPIFLVYNSYSRHTDIIVQKKHNCLYQAMGKNKIFINAQALSINLPEKGQKGTYMRRGKLEMYIHILKVLAHNGPLKLTHIMYKANLNCSVLKEYLDFLKKQSLVEERTVGKAKVVFAITQRGIMVLKYFRELQQALPTEEESTNRISTPIW